MTREEIDALPAGRELDALVGEKVLEKKPPTVSEMEAEARRAWLRQPSAVWFHSLGGFSAWEDDLGLHLEAHIKPYSTDIAAAWEVVEKIDLFGDTYNYFLARNGDEWCVWEGDWRVVVGAETVPLAICRAALRAVATTMVRVPSTTTLLPLSAVADAAGVTRQTIYNWLNAGAISHRYDVAGSSVFTHNERDQIVEVAKQRRTLLAEVRLPKRPGKEEV